MRAVPALRLQAPTEMTLAPKLVLSLALLPLAACGGNNIGVLWDPDRGGGGGGATDGTGITVVPEGGKVVDGRPRVESAFPRGAGWPLTVPIVVVFNESIARSSVDVSQAGGGGPAPIGGTGPGVLIRVEGTELALPAQFSWALGDRVVILTPTAPLSAGQIYEVVVGTDVRDVDAVRKGGSSGEVVATFQPDEADTETDGKIVAVIPEDGEREAMRESDILVVFDRAADVGTVTDVSFQVTAGGVAITGNRDFPIEIAGVPDPRVLRFRPSQALPGGSVVDVTVDATITFGQGTGTLDFNGRTPFAAFDTVRGAMPARVTVGNAPDGYPDQVNATNVSNLAIDVDVDASVPIGSRVFVRIYGLEPQTEDTSDIAFLEKVVDVPADGPTTVSVVFAGDLGAPAQLRFDEGPLSLLARVEVDNATSAFASAGSGPSLDVTAPEIEAFLPALPGSSTDVVTDQESISIVGRASEPLGVAELTAGGMTVAAHGASADGTFLLRPIELGRRTEPLSYVLAVTDRAGNSAAMPIEGRILQRGLVAGAVAGSLTVEVYDDATFAPVPGALVVVEPDMPRKPAVGRRVETTGADGRVTITGLASARHSVTVVADGYDLITVLDVPSAFMSLPVRPTDPAVATATIEGALGFLPTAGQTGIVGVNALDDPVALEVASSAQSANSFGPVSVRAGRALVVNAFTGIFPPSAVPAFAGYACRLCGPTGTTPSGPEAPLTGGESLELTIPILPSIAAVTSLAAPYDLDFAAAAGLGDLTGPPVVRVHGTLAGFGRSALFGVGFATLTAGAQYSVQASFAQPMVGALSGLGPTLWVSTEARDSDGNLSRHRQLISETNLGLTFGTGAPLGVPTVAPPAGASTGAPEVVVEDRVDPLSVPGGVAFLTLEVEDGAGRRWQLLRQDRDGAGGQEQIQIPDLSGVGAVGLASGTWNVTASSELMFSTTAGDGDFVLEERHRQQIKLGRAATVAFSVQ